MEVILGAAKSYMCALQQAIESIKGLVVHIVSSHQIVKIEKQLREANLRQIDPRCNGSDSEFISIATLDVFSPCVLINHTFNSAQIRSSTAFPTMEGLKNAHSYAFETPTSK